MEILAPAGSKEAFLAAIKAGADSIYVGLKDFNARKNANNLNFYDLEVLTDYAHSKNVKVYVVLNILIKHEEINDAAKMIAQINQIGVDALIVQDLGLARIIHDYFPNLRLHASTQLACHNSAGAKVLADLGFKRVVLARELTFSEIKSITRNKEIEYEIFVHGALCFSLSGMCLFSSFIGGFSGNRGLCTQPCRRLWNSTKQAKGYLFSPKDLELFDYLEKIKKDTGVCSLKIEGRMRSSEYVFNAVSEYKNGVKVKDFAREKSACLFSGRDEKLFEPQKAQCLGVKITDFSKSKLKLGDRIRVVDPKNDQNLIVKFNGEVPKGEIYLTGSNDFDEKALTKELNEIYAKHEPKIYNLNFSNQYTSLIARVWDNKPAEETTLWFKINDPDWIPLLNSKNIIFSVNQTNLWYIPEDVVVELPPFIAEREINDYKNIMAEKFVLNNISHFDIVPETAEKISGPFLYAWNGYSAKALKDLGVSKFFVSWEDDILNIRKLKFPLIVNLFGKPVLTRSRMLTKEHDYGTIMSDKKDIELEQLMEGSLSLLVTKKPVMIFNAKEKLKAAGVNDFCLDLSFIEPNEKFLANLMQAYQKNENFIDSVKFNFKQGVQ